MTMQTDIQRYGARPVEHQAVTVPDPQPQRGPPAATGKANQEEKRRQQAKSLSSHPEMSDVLLVFAQWNAEGLRKKKPELQEFLKREGVDIICIQETHLTEAHRFTLRGYELVRYDRADRHKGGIVILVRNTIPAVEVGRSEGDLAIRVVLQGREITVINYYCPPDKELQLHTLPLVNHNLLITGDSNGHSLSWRYADLNSKGEQIEDWGIVNSLILINRPDDQRTHLSRAWKTMSTPDLAIASEDIQKICDMEVYTQLTCRELDTDNSKNINTSVQQLTDCILRQKEGLQVFLE